MKRKAISQHKGSRGEREFVNFLKSLGIKARRGQQYKGTPDSPDIIHDLKGVHFEVKRTEVLRVFDYLSQAENEAPDNEIPIVVWKRNRKRWIAIADAETLIKRWVEK